MEKQAIKLVLKNLKKQYGEVVAVDQINLEVYTGEFLTLLGPSGSGKTTTLQMIAGFESPTEGEICIEGKDILNTPPFKRNIGMVFQNYALFPHMTAHENIAFPLKMRKLKTSEIKDRVEKVLDKVRLPGLGNRYPKQLSGGQQQRIALARSLVFDPPLLLMDEPLGALDKKLREYMQIEIKNLQRDLAITTIYVTHDQVEALTMSNRIAVFNRGRIEQIGTPEEVYDLPANRFVAEFIGETNFLEGSIERIDNRGALFKSIGGSVFLVKERDGISIGEKATAIIRPENIALFTEKVEGFNMIEGYVEDMIYVGDTRLYRVRLNEKESIFLKQQNFLDTGVFRKQDKVLMGWKVHATHIFRYGT